MWHSNRTNPFPSVCFAQHLSQPTLNQEQLLLVLNKCVWIMVEAIKGMENGCPFLHSGTSRLDLKTIQNISNLPCQLSKACYCNSDSGQIQAEVHRS